MPRVAFYIKTPLPKENAVALYKSIADGIGKDCGYDSDAKKRIDLQLKSVEQAQNQIFFFERIKQEINSLSEVSAIQSRPDFVRFACGGYDSIFTLITERKRAGRSDWYV